MKIEILGSGGATLTPRPFSTSRVSQNARQKGLPYSRMGPSFFIHDIHLLIDTPEEIALMLERSQIEKVEACLYSHWHPDHTAGLRVFESNLLIWTYPPQSRTTTIYLPPLVARDFQIWLALKERADYLEKRHTIRQVPLREGELITLNGITIQPILLAVGYVYAFLFSDGQSRVLIIPDETFGWVPPDDLPSLDLLIMPAGLFEFDPFTGTRIIPAQHPVLEEEATFAQTLEMVRKIKTRCTILAHIEEVNDLDYDDLNRLAAKLRAEAPELGDISFAYDRQIIVLDED